MKKFLVKITEKAKVSLLALGVSLLALSSFGQGDVTKSVTITGLWGNPATNILEGGGVLYGVQIDYLGVSLGTNLTFALVDAPLIPSPTYGLTNRIFWVSTNTTVVSRLITNITKTITNYSGVVTNYTVNNASFTFTNSQSARTNFYPVLFNNVAPSNITTVFDIPEGGLRYGRGITFTNTQFTQPIRITLTFDPSL